MCEMTVGNRFGELVEEAKGHKTIRQFLNDVGGIMGMYIADWKVEESDENEIGACNFYDVIDPDGEIVLTIDIYSSEGLIADVEVLLPFTKHIDFEEVLTYMKCQLCESGDMEYRSIPNPKAMNEEKVTHIWVCNQCPNVMLEWYDHSDTEALLKGLN